MYMNYFFNNVVPPRNRRINNRNLNMVNRTIQFPIRPSNTFAMPIQRHSRNRPQYNLLNLRYPRTQRQRQNNSNSNIIQNIMNNANPAMQVPINANNGNENNEERILDVTGNEEFFETRVSLENNNYMNINYISDDAGMSLYYSTFNFNTQYIRFNHDDMLSPNDAEYVLQEILSNLYQNEINNIMNESILSFQNESHENDSYTKNMIKNNMIIDKYYILCDKIKNDTCPISMELFENNDEVIMFRPCSHAICNTYEEQFLKLFKKCPLCNCDLTCIVSINI